MKSWWLLALPAACAVAAIADAQQQMTPIPTTTSGTVHSATITGTSAQLIGTASSNTNRVYLRLANQSGTDTVRCVWGTAAAVAADTAGQETLLPYAQMIWEGNFTPPDRLNCISSGSSTPFTYQIGP